MDGMPQNVECIFTAYNATGEVVAKKHLTSDDFSDALESFYIDVAPLKTVRITADLALSVKVKS